MSRLPSHPHTRGCFRTFDKSLLSVIESIPSPWFDHIDATLPVEELPYSDDHSKFFREVKMHLRFMGTYNPVRVKVLADAACMYRPGPATRLTEARLTEHCSGSALLALELDYSQPGPGGAWTTRTYAVDFFAYVMRMEDEMRVLDHMTSLQKEAGLRIQNGAAESDYSTAFFAPLCGWTTICFTSPFRFRACPEHLVVVVNTNGVGCALDT